MGDHSGFVADPAAVHTFGSDFQHDLDVHLSAEKIQTLHLFSATPTFGLRAVNSEVQQTAKDYIARLRDLYDLLEVLLHNGAVLTEAAHTIAEAYETADTLTATQVTGALATARATVTATSNPTDPKTGRPL
ncbi:hypothetical protein [Dactylosporangium sp. NPDC051541]|uniref:hypothetical protein n=1 Tax=Dactylosporangium sp. NPDC051541 TaxID=3363977 RepID=UPI00379AE76D